MSSQDASSAVRLILKPEGESEMACTKCGAENAPTAKFCRGCGSSLSAAAPAAGAHCPQCENICSPGAKFCPKCGHSFLKADTASMPPAVSATKLSPPSPPPAIPEPKASAPPEPPPARTQPLPPPPRAVQAPSPPPVAEQRPKSATQAARPATAHDGSAARAPLIIAAVAVIAIAVAGGGVYYWKYLRVLPGSSAGPAQEMSVDAPVAVTPELMTPEPMAPEQSAQESMTQESLLPEQPGSGPPPMESSPTIATETATTEAAIAPPIPAAPPPAPAAPAARQPEIPARIDAMLRQGREYKQQLQYDKAIATAESVLMFDPGNRDAKRLMQDAKEGQQAALNSIEID